MDWFSVFPVVQAFFLVGQAFYPVSQEFYEYCLRQFEVAEGEIKITTNETEYAFGTYFMELLINYINLKIDEDLEINKSINPKMLIISVHGTTINT